MKPQEYTGHTPPELMGFSSERQRNAYLNPNLEWSGPQKLRTEEQMVEAVTVVGPEKVKIDPRGTLSPIDIA